VAIVQQFHSLTLKCCKCFDKQAGKLLTRSIKADIRIPDVSHIFVDRAYLDDQSMTLSIC